MKKNLVLAVFVFITLIFAGSLMYGDSADDFKVIKNGVKSKGGAIKSLNVTVYNKTKKKNTVKIKIPFALVELFSDCAGEGIKFKGKHDFDFKKVLKILKRTGPMTLVEIEEDDEVIKVWFE